MVAPDAAATDFGAAFSLDADRLGVTAKLDGTPVLYVFDRSGDSWTHSATIHPGVRATSFWGRYVAVSGTTIAVGDSATRRTAPASSVLCTYTT